MPICVLITPYNSLGEKLTDDEVEQLLAGQDDAHGLIAYEGE